MRHDYQLPPEWDAMTQEEKDKWFKQERARRQLLRQNTPGRRHLEKTEEKLTRKRRARNETRDIKP